MKKSTITPVAAALGTALTLGLASTAQAADNPFGMQDLNNGYQIAMGDKPAEGKCGEKKAEEGKCGGEKATEAKCGGEKATEAKCGEKKPEAKCGAGK
jgi:uncharacterized low-complexity protein